MGIGLNWTAPDALVQGIVLERQKGANGDYIAPCARENIAANCDYKREPAVLRARTLRLPPEVSEHDIKYLTT